MSNIILSGGIRGIEWQDCVNAFAQINKSINVKENLISENVELFEKMELNEELSAYRLKNVKKQLCLYLAKLAAKKKNAVNIFYDNSMLDDAQTLNEIDNRHHFLFFFCSPEYRLAKAKINGENSEELLNLWIEDALNIWDFYTRFPEKTYVLNIEDVALDITECFKSIITYTKIKTLAVSRKTANKLFEQGGLAEKLSFLTEQNLQLIELKNNRNAKEVFNNLSLVSIMSDDNSSYDENGRLVRRLHECHELSLQLSREEVYKENEFKQQLLKCRQLEENISGLESSNLASQKLLEVLSKDIEKQSSENKNNDSVIKQMKRHNDGLELKIEKLQKEKISLNSIMSKQDIDNSELNNKNINSLNHISQLKEQLDSAHRAYNLHVQECTGLETQVSELEILLAKSIEELEQKNKEDKVHTELTAEYKIKLEGLNSINADLRATIGDLQKKHNELEKSHFVLTGKNKLAIEHISELLRELELTNLALEQKNLDNTDIQEQMSALENSLSNLSYESAHNNSEKIEGYESEIQKLLVAKEELLTDKELCLIQINHLQRELEYHYSQYQKVAFTQESKNDYIVDPNKLSDILTLAEILNFDRSNLGS